MLHESGLDDVEDSIGPFLEGYGCDDDLVKACGDAVMKCGNNNGATNGETITNGSDNNTSQGAVKLKQGIVSMSSALTDQSEAEMGKWEIFGLDVCSSFAFWHLKEPPV